MDKRQDTRNYLKKHKRLNETTNRKTPDQPKDKRQTENAEHD